MFRKIFFILIGLLFLASPVMATDYYVDTACGDNGDGTWDSSGDGCDDDGGATDGAFNDLRDVLQLNTFTAGDKIWIRRTSSHDEGVENDNADIAMTEDGTAASPIYYIGYPRASHSWNADFTSGSTTVDNIDENDADREQHQGRWLTGPDGFDYLITDITDANTVIIDRPYAGGTSSDEDVSIKADDDYTEAAALEGGEVLADWGGDADDLPLIDFNNEAYQLNLGGDTYLVLKNLEIRDSTDTNSLINLSTSYETIFNGVLIMQNSDSQCIGIYDNCMLILDRFIMEGDSGTASQKGIRVRGNDQSIILKNGALYNLGGVGIEVVSFAYLENINFGVEVPNSGDEITLKSEGSLVIGRDIKLDGTNGFISSDHYYKTVAVKLSNYQKVLGAYKEWSIGRHEIKKVAVTDTNANKKLSDNVIEITPYTANTYQSKEIEAKAKVWESRKTYDAGTYNVKVWIYNDTGNVLNDTTFSDDICMRCRPEAGSYGDAATEYVSMPWTYSDEIDIEDAAVGGDDWDFLQCDSVVVDENDTKIYCEILVSTYDAQADVILIDPESTNP